MKRAVHSKVGDINQAFIIADQDSTGSVDPDPGRKGPSKKSFMAV